MPPRADKLSSKANLSALFKASISGRRLQAAGLFELPGFFLAVCAFCICKTSQQLEGKWGKSRLKLFLFQGKGGRQQKESNTCQNYISPQINKFSKL